MANAALTRLAGTLCCCWLALAGSALRAEPLVLIGDEWCPYNCAEDNPQPGYLVDLLASIFKAEGLTVEYRVIPWTRAIKMVEEGQADLLLATTPDTTPDLPLSVAVGEDRTCFFVPANSTWHYRDLADLQRQRLGVVQDYSYDGGGPLDAYIATSPAEDGRVLASSGANALQNNFNKLLAGRVDLVLENCNVGLYSLQRYGLREQIREAGSLAYYRGELNIGLSPRNPQAARLTELIGRGLAERRASGELQRLLQPYGMQDWAPLPTPASTPAP